MGKLRDLLRERSKNLDMSNWVQERDEDKLESPSGKEPKTLLFEKISPR
jgi:hypothetical protein